MSKEQRFDIHQHITNQIVGHPDRPNPENTFTNHPRPRTSQLSEVSLLPTAVCICKIFAETVSSARPAV